MKDLALLAKWERTYWLIRLWPQLFLNDAVRWARHHLPCLPRDEVTEEWLESMSEAELDEFLMLAEQIEKRVVALQIPQQQLITLGRSIFDHKSCGRFLDEQVATKSPPTGTTGHVGL